MRKSGTLNLAMKKHVALKPAALTVGAVAAHCCAASHIILRPWQGESAGEAQVAPSKTRMRPTNDSYEK